MLNFLLNADNHNLGSESMRNEVDPNKNPTNTSRRLARKRGTTLKKTDEDHPFNKRMKLEGENEQAMKENSMGYSN
jgi:hypothetical protein